jgi:hypothetical protein
MGYKKVNKHFYLVFDVEGAGNTGGAFVYDIGGKVVDRKGNVYERFSFLVKDIFQNGYNDIMATAYYFEKIPLYFQEIADKKIHLHSFYDVRYHVMQLIKEYKIKEVFAYNASYDRDALNHTQRYLTDGRFSFFFPFEIQINCIMYMACQVICTKKSYYNFCVTNGFVSAKGNIQTKAEVVYRYITNDVNFKEKHMGAYDSDIEAEILNYCFKQKKKMEKGIRGNCWRIPQRKNCIKIA